MISAFRSCSSFQRNVSLTKHCAFLNRRREFSQSIARSSRILMAVSGGVDSSVATHLLLKQNHEVDCIYVKSWDQVNELGYCQSDLDFEDASKICNHLGVKLETIDFVSKYWVDVFEPFIESYRNGLTPNPDVDCNKKIKFGPLLEYSREKGYDYLATGHFAQLVPSAANDGTLLLKRSPEPVKDQTYFLNSLTQENLRNVMFPVGHLTKNEIRAIALDAGIHVHDKNSSVGICFVGKRKFSDFIEEYIPPQPGFFRDDQGEIVGLHRGHFEYTIGQRAKIGGLKTKFFVYDKDVKNNVVFVAPTNHLALFMSGLMVDTFSWINGIPKDLLMKSEHNGATVDALKCTVQLRHHAPQFEALVKIIDENHVKVEFNENLRVCAPGQYTVLYHDGICLGGGKNVKVFHDKLKGEQKDNA